MCAEPQFFNDRGAVQTMKNRLPHWEQDGCTYFITFRLADSLPKQLLDTWKEERRVWMVRHPKPWSSEVEQAYHHRFSGARERWLDAGHGHCVLRQLSAREALLDVIDQQSCDVWSVVMMPNHVHVLVSFSAGLELSALMQRLKGGSSLEINKRIGRRGPLWAKDYFDRCVRDASHFYKCARYIRRNPVKAQLREGAFTLVESAYVQRLLGGS